MTRMLRRMHSLPLEPLLTSGLFPGDADSAAICDRLETLLQRAIEAATAGRDEWTLDVSPEEVAGSVSEGARRVKSYVETASLLATCVWHHAYNAS